ncbi:MAG: response regulator transcription factor [Bacteroidota bacterium]
MIRVAIVEDISDIRQGLELILNTTDGFTCVSTFSNAEDAVLNLPALNVDVVVMDIHLPGMTGIECITRIKDKCAGTQFMMFSVYDDDDNIFDALKAGAAGYLLKKTSPGKIIDAIVELQNGGSPMSAHIARKVVSAFRQPEKNKTTEDALSSREMEVLQLLAKGLLYKEIAVKLSIATGTVKQHIHNIYEKLHVQNKTEAINKIFKNTAKI